VVHPAPSVIVSAAVLGLAWAAGAPLLEALLLGFAMLGFQFSIGALNDLVDAPADARAKPGKPLPAGAIGTSAVVVIVAVGALVGLIGSAWFGPLVLALGAVGLSCGVAYDLVARRYDLGWLCLSLALPVLLLWTWAAATGALPPGWPLLLPLAALAGSALHLANSLVDMETDQAAGRSSLATRLGARRGPRVLAWLFTGVYGLAWLALIAIGSFNAAVVALGLLASVLAVGGVAASWRPGARSREAGWLLQAGALALLALTWTIAASDT
jgi:4-hydroxybenzoate polyprenyltransferase